MVLNGKITLLHCVLHVGLLTAGHWNMTAKAACSADCSWLHSIMLHCVSVEGTHLVRFNSGPQLHKHRVWECAEGMMT